MLMHAFPQQSSLLTSTGSAGGIIFVDLVRYCIESVSSTCVFVSLSMFALRSRSENKQSGFFQALEYYEMFFSCSDCETLADSDD